MWRLRLYAGLIERIPQHAPPICRGGFDKLPRSRSGFQFPVQVAVVDPGQVSGTRGPVTGHTDCDHGVFGRTDREAAWDLHDLLVYTVRRVDHAATHQFALDLDLGHGRLASSASALR